MFSRFKKPDAPMAPRPATTTPVTQATPAARLVGTAPPLAVKPVALAMPPKAAAEAAKG